MGWGWGKNRVGGGVVDNGPGASVVVKFYARLLDKNDVCCFVCKVEEGILNIGRLCCIV